MKITTLPIIERSHVEYDGTHYALMNTAVKGEKKLVIAGDTAGFEGREHESGPLLCTLSAANAARLRQRLPWLQPVPLGLKTSAGFGDRLGCATVGHLMAVEDTNVAPILAQQSVRENERTERSPQQVLDDAMWGVFEFGWRNPWGADADHLKTVEDIAPFVTAGYTFYTIDPGDYVDDAAEQDDAATLREKAARLDWETLQTDLDTLVKRLTDMQMLKFTESAVLRAVVKYGAAVVHTVHMVTRIRELMDGKPFDLEVSVDETGTTTTHIQHFYIVSELKRLGIAFTSVAPRFTGRFEKGVDYIGDLDALDQDLEGHAIVMQHFDNTYKLSLHTGSDKFGVYPPAMRHTDGHLHLKTAGTSYLEALRVMAVVEPHFFRDVLDFARDRYEEDRKTYHVSASLENVPTAAALTDDQLPDLLNQFDARQVLHVTYGSVLDTFGDRLTQMLDAHETDYRNGLKTHFDRHLAAFNTG